MAGSDNGYITITAGMPDPGARRRPPTDRRLSRGELCELAVKLRKQGWSYRRVSTELRVDYSTVRRWLDRDVLTVVPGPHRSRPSAAIVTTAPSVPAVPGAPGASPMAAGTPPSGLEDLVAENRRLGERIDRLARAQEAQVRAMTELEGRLVDAMEAQHRSLVERLVETVKSLFTRGTGPG
ncbi:MAG TPA: helix-turn-helix domain-containing protein [Arenibaculum sp.]|nr:helix-turn-helix domain-containing protein [Arenibaculum sp.]